MTSALCFLRHWDHLSHVLVPQRMILKLREDDYNFFPEAVAVSCQDFVKYPQQFDDIYSGSIKMHNMDT